MRRITIEDIAGQVEQNKDDRNSPTMNESSSTEQPELTTSSVATTTNTTSTEARSREGAVCDSVQDLRDTRDERHHSAPSNILSESSERVPEESRSEGGDGGASELPPLPETSFEFQSQWKNVRSNRPHLVNYFKVCRPLSTIHI